MMIEAKETPTPTPKTSKNLVRDDTMQIDQTNVTIKIHDTNPFEIFNQPESQDKVIQDQLKQIEKEKRQLKVEKRKIEEAKHKLLEEEIKRRVKEEKSRGGRK